MQRLVSPQNTRPNKCFYLTLPFQQRASISSLFSCACAFTSKILSRILPGLDIASFPLGLCPILNSKIISHILQNWVPINNTSSAASFLARDISSIFADYTDLPAYPGRYTNSAFSFTVTSHCLRHKIPHLLKRINKQHEMHTHTR